MGSLEAGEVGGIVEAEGKVVGASAQVHRVMAMAMLGPSRSVVRGVELRGNPASAMAIVGDVRVDGAVEVRTVR